MSKFQESAAVSIWGNDMDDGDFDLDILDDLDLLETIIDDMQSGDSGEKRVLRKSDRTKERAFKAAASRSILKYKAPEPRRSANNNDDNEATVTHSLIETHHATSAVADPIYVGYIDELFKYRLFRHSVANNPQRGLPDSIYNFTYAMINCLNSGDTQGLSDLLQAHMDRDCTLGLMCFHSMMSPQAFMEYLWLLNVIHPDRILRISDVNSVKNRISSSVLLKFTDCRVLFDSAAVNDPSILSMFHSRREHYNRRMCIADAEPRQEVVKLVESEDDLVVYGKLQYNVTFDVVTKKVTGLYISGGLTSAHPASVNIRG